MPEAAVHTNVPRCLIVCPLPPYPPDNGWVIRHEQFIDGLSRCFSCDVVALWQGADSERQELVRQIRHRFSIHAVTLIPQPKRTRLQRALFARVRKHPLNAENFYEPALHAWLREQTQRVDYAHVVLLGDLATAQYAGSIRTRQLTWDLCDDVVLFSRRRASLTRNPYHKVYFGVKSGCLQRYLQRVVPAFDRITVISAKDGNTISAMDAGEVHTVPNAVDLERFHPQARSYDRRPQRLVFTGVASYYPNRDAIRFFCRKVWPKIRMEAPEAEFQVAGKGSERLRIKVPGLRLAGTVSDLPALYRDADIVVCPLRTGTGIKNKVLEAMASGCPVVTTRIGAEGIPVRDGEEVLLADSPEEFAAAVVRLWREPALRAHLGGNARKFAEEHFSWQHTDAAIRRAFPKAMEM